MEQRWRIELFGGIRVTRGEAAFDLSGQLSGFLVGYLASHENWASRREDLLLLLWPDEEPEVARNRLNQMVFQLKRLFEPGTGGESLLLTGRTTIQLSHGAFTSDFEDFRDAKAKASIQGSEERIAGLHSAIALYRGEFMAGSYFEWVYATRQHWLNQFVDSNRELVKLLCAKGRYHEAEKVATEVIRHDPLDEGLYRDLMEIYRLSNRGGLAVRQYRILEEILRLELNVGPSGQTVRLYEDLLHSSKSTVGPEPTPDRVAPAVTVQMPERDFFGRNDELSQIRKALAEHGLVTILGPGGIGKTRIAQEAASLMRRSDDASVWTVPLEDVRKPELILVRVKEILGGEDSANSPLLDQIRTRLEEVPKPLLILDNLEQLGSEAGPEITDLLTTVPRLKILATSRHSLGVRNSWELVLEPLPVPQLGRYAPAELAGVPSVQLFVERARKVHPQFQVTKSRAESIAVLSRRLEGIPLAIELAAAWANTLTVGEMLTRLARRFDLLSIRGGANSDRHRTLKATIADGFALLRPELQKQFVRLSIFRGGWSLEAAEAVCAFSQEERSSMILLLAELRERSFISVELPSSTSEALGLGGRYRMLETLREFGAEHLANDERTILLERRAEFLLEMAREASGGLTGRRQSEWIIRLEADYENILDVVNFAANDLRNAAGFKIGWLIWRFWYFSKRADQGAVVLRSLLGPLDEQAIVDVDRAQLAVGLGFLTVSQGRLDEAQAAFNLALAYAESTDRHELIATSLNGLGCVDRERREYDEAIRHYSEALKVANRLDDEFLPAAIAGNMAEIHAYREDWSAAGESYRQAQLWWARQGADFYLAMIDLYLAHIEARLGRYDTAAKHARQAAEIVERVGLDYLYDWVLAETADIACRYKLFDEAALLLNASSKNQPERDRTFLHDRAVSRVIEQLKAYRPDSAALPQGEAISQREAFEVCAKVLATKAN